MGKTDKQDNYSMSMSINRVHVKREKVKWVLRFYVGSGKSDENEIMVGEK